VESRVHSLLRPYLSLFLILKEEEDMDIGFIKDMVAEVNSTQVEPEEVLSDSVYHYNKSEQVFSKIEDNCPVQCMDIRM